MTLLQGIAALYLDGVLIRFVPVAGPRTRRLVASVVAVNAVLASVVTVGFLLGLSLWSPRLEYLRANPWMALGFVALTVALSNSLVLDGALTGLRETSWVLAKNGSLAVGRILLLVTLSPLVRHTGILDAWVIAAVVMFIPSNLLLFWWLIPRHPRSSLEGEQMVARDIGGYALGNYGAALLNVASNSVLPLLVLHQSGSAASARFYLPWTMSLALRLISINMSSSLIVEGTMDIKRLFHYGRQAITNTTRQSVPIVAVLALGAPQILRIFGAGYATDGATLLRLLALATLPSTVCVLYIGIARVQYRVLGVVLLQGGIVVATLGLSAIFLPTHGIVAVGVIWLATQSVAAAFLLLTALRPILSRTREDGPECGRGRWAHD
jgi:O-antigen/teichoic acid export membrane protein